MKKAPAKEGKSRTGGGDGSARCALPQRAAPEVCPRGGFAAEFPRRGETSGRVRAGGHGPGTGPGEGPGNSSPRCAPEPRSRAAFPRTCSRGRCGCPKTCARGRCAHTRGHAPPRVHTSRPGQRARAPARTRAFPTGTAGPRGAPGAPRRGPQPSMGSDPVPRG